MNTTCGYLYDFDVNCTSCIEFLSKLVNPIYTVVSVFDIEFLSKLVNPIYTVVSVFDIEFLSKLVNPICTVVSVFDIIFETIRILVFKPIRPFSTIFQLYRDNPFYWWKKTRREKNWSAVSSLLQIPLTLTLSPSLVKIGSGKNKIP